jgi:hypothetical protein
VAHERTIDKKLKVALDETRLLILGAEVLLGFQFTAVFQTEFAALSSQAQELNAIAYLFMAITIAILIAPSMQHRLVEHGHSSNRLLRSATICATFALLPFAAAFGIDLYIALVRHLGNELGVVIALVYVAMAGALWFGASLMLRKGSPPMNVPSESGETPLPIKVEQMLTEARVLLPGAQALFGFQMAATLTTVFDALPRASQLIHILALLCIALAVVLLIAPAAIHRIAYGGDDHANFHRLGSALLIVAAVPLALGITLDLYVIAERVYDSVEAGTAMAALCGAILLVLWYLHPLLLRLRLKKREAA